MDRINKDLDRDQRFLVGCIVFLIAVPVAIAYLRWDEISQGDSDERLGLVAGTPSPTPTMLEGAQVLLKACPALIDSADRYDVLPAEEGRASLTAQREFGAETTVLYNVMITADSPSAGYDVGHRCGFEVGPAGVIVSKTACVQLCTGDDDPPASFLVRRI